MTTRATRRQPRRRLLDYQQARAIMDHDELPLWSASRQRPADAACDVGAENGVSP